MKKTLAMLFASAMIFTTIGCGGGMAAKFEGFVNEICECKDAKCLEGVQKKMAKFAEENKGKQPSADDAKAMAPLTKKMTECTTKIMKEAAKK